MSLPGEVGKVADSAIDALKGSPALLVLVFLQIGTLGAVYFATQATQTRNQERELTILNRCFPPSHRSSDVHGSGPMDPLGG